jgi:uncharacterized membrane protein YbhN (UPF0104 family)
MQPSNHMSSLTWKSWYSRVLFAAVLISVIYYMSDTIKGFSYYHYRIDWGYLFLSVIFSGVAYILQLIIWIRLAEAFDLHAPFISAAKMWSLSQLGKYVPGKVGLILMRINIYPGVSKRKLSVATGVEFISAMAAACLLVLVAFILTPEWDSNFIRWTAFILACSMLILLYPPILKIYTGWIFRIFKREPLAELPTYGLLLKLVGCNMFVGLPYGLGLFFAFNSFLPVSWNHFLTITGVYYAAALIGVAAIFAPAGLGVREGIVFLVLPAFIPKPEVIFGTILTRLIITAVEIFLAIVFTWAEKWWNIAKRE